MIGPHLQRTIPGWLEAVARLPAGAPVKAVDDYHICRDAKAANPGVYTTFRKWYDLNQTYDDAPMTVKRDRARGYFNSFIDGTFRNIAHHVSAIGLWNEEYAASQSPVERQRRIDQDRAFLEVWVSEYHPEFPHIDLHLTSAAPGNSIPLGIAALGHMYRKFPLSNAGAVLDYHGYTAVRDGQVVPTENIWCSGRWMVDDAMYRQNGYIVKWFLSEIGATGWGDNAFDFGGWRHGRVYGGNLNNYLNGAIQDNLTRWGQWSAAHPGLFKGGVLFTVNANADPRWQSYEMDGAQLSIIAEYVRTHTGSIPPPQPPPQSDWNKLVVLLPQNTSLEQYVDIATSVAYNTKTEIAFSADSAFDPPSRVGTHRVIVYDVAQWGGAVALEAWALARFGPLPVIEYRNF